MDSSTLSLGDRMKYYYENASKNYLPWRMPVILRIDGRAFHTFTWKMIRPFDDLFMSNMIELANVLCKKIVGCVLAYGQSDEISFLLHNYKKIESQAFFGNEVQKTVSVVAGMASAWFAQRYSSEDAVFDARMFVLPEAEVCNYFIWRQQDAIRNSIQSVAQSQFSDKELYKRNQSDMLALLNGRGIDWYQIPIYKQRGWCVVKQDCGWCIDKEVPKFTANRAYIESLLNIEQQ